MRPRLHTIESLSVETGRDRRAVAKALREVPPDGKVGPRDGWLLTTALKALANRSGAAPYRSSGGIANLDEAVAVAQEFQTGLERAEREPDLRERRKILTAIAPLFGRLHDLLEQGADEAPFRNESERWASEFIREQALADALATFCALGCWQVAGAPLLPVESLLEAQRQGVDVGSIK
jgi:hypothetical protein